MAAEASSRRYEFDILMLNHSLDYLVRYEYELLVQEEIKLCAGAGVGIGIGIVRDNNQLQHYPFFRGQRF